MKKKLKKNLNNKSEKSKEIDEIIEEIKEFDKLENNNKNCQYTFSENDFIKLRTLHHKPDTIYYLAIHIKSLHIFLMKKIKDINQITHEMEREMNFCKYSNRLFVRFYGFIKKCDMKTGLIYEFMSNGSLNFYLTQTQVDSLYLILTISRIFKGIDFLHKNGLIHRDLKPVNILIDHNNLAFISDFETIRSPESTDGPFTENIGGISYSSPEQDQNKNISYPTDIYSFGKIINFLYGRTNLWSNCSNSIHNLYTKCIEYKAED